MYTRNIGFLAGFLTVVALQTGAAGAEEIRLRLAFEPPVAEETPGGSLLRVPSTELFGAPGAPVLPAAAYWLLVPGGHEVDSVRLEALQTESVPGLWRLAPGQAPVPFSARMTPAPTPPDPAIYRSDLSFPAAWAEPGGPQWLHGHALAPVTIHPLRYRPASGRVERLVSAELTLVTRPVSRAPREVLPVRGLPRDAAEVAGLLSAGVEHLESYRATVPRAGGRLPPGSFAYLIVAPRVFHGLPGPDSLEALAAARTALGLPAALVALEDIQADYPGQRPDGGQDDATRVREFLQEAYLSWGARYVLLVGDADKAPVGGEAGPVLLPVRKFRVNASGTSELIPADLYYACLDGSFDHDADGTYGERRDGPNGGPVDVLAELQVGRAPADSPEEVAHFVRKTLAYEAGLGNWLKDVWMVGEKLDDTPTWGGTCLDELIHGASTGGITTLGFDAQPFFQCQTLYDRDRPQPWRTDDVMAVLDAGPHLVNHLGHSNVLYNMRMDVGDAAWLRNTRPFFLYSQGCFNGSFDNSAPEDEGGGTHSLDSIAEHLGLGPHGAFAQVVNSRYGWYSPGSTNAISQHFHRLYWSAFFNLGKQTLGEALSASKAALAWMVDDAYFRWVIYELNLLGDPAVQLKRAIGTDQPLVGLYPPALGFFAILGEPETQRAALRLVNDGLGGLSYTLSADQAWLEVGPQSGAAPADLEVAADSTGLEAGEHLGRIEVTSPEAQNSPVEFAVSLTVVEVPAVRVPHGGPAPALDGVLSPGEYDRALRLPIGRADPEAVDLYALVAEGKLHLAVEDRVDTTQDEADQILLSFDRDLDRRWPEEPNGPEGFYWALAGWGGYRVFYPAYNAGQGMEIDYSHGQQSPPGFAARAGWVDGHRVWELSLDLTTSRLNVGPTGAFGLNFQVRHSVDNSLVVRTGNWPARVPEVDDQRYFGLVDLEPEGPGLELNPTELSLVAVEGDPPPAPQAVWAASSDGGALAFQVTASQPWLRFEPAAGATPAGLVVGVEHAGLTPGSYLGELWVAAPQSWNGAVRVPVALTVLPPPARLELEPMALTWTAAVGGGNPRGSLTLHNQGGRPLDFEIQSAGGLRALAQPATGLLFPGSEVRVEVTALLTDLTPGRHQGALEISAVDALGSPASVALSLDLVPERSVPPVEALELERLADAIRLVWRLPADSLAIGVKVRRNPAFPVTLPGQGVALFEGLAEELEDSDVVLGRKYCYSLFAFDAAGRHSEPVWACGAPGENRAPPAPAPLSPLDGASLTGAPDLVVGLAVDPDGDEVQTEFRLTDEAGVVLESGPGQAGLDRVTYRPSGRYAPGQAVRWQARAVDAPGAASDWSPAWTFRIRETVSLDGGPDGGPGDGGGQGGCGCAAGGAGPDPFGPGLYALALSALGLARRRRA
jgi:hypothetical protein